ncbi:MAG: thiamine phosphate synthase [Bryobacteraceae bacterium]
MIFPPFYPILDTTLIEQRRIGTVAAAEALIEAGVRILQLRHKGFFSRTAFEEASSIAEMCRRAEVLFVVNDRADVAKLLDAALHLGQDDLTPSDARKILPAENIIGFSTHNEQQLRAADAEPADYLAIGPIFATGSKLNPDPVVGLDRLRTLRALTRKPLVAIGGITRELAPKVFEAGANSVAIIGDLFTGDSLRARAEDWIAISDDARARAVRPR